MCLSVASSFPSPRGVRESQLKRICDGWQHQGLPLWLWERQEGTGPNWLSLRAAQASAQAATWATGGWYFPRAKRKFAKRKLLSHRCSNLEQTD